jgi:hypothetical protein
MDFISALIAAYLALLWMVAMYFVERRPVSTRIKCKYRVADDSILRKIIPFKDRPNMPCIYFKIVPIYIYLLIAMLMTVIFLADLISGCALSTLISVEIANYISLAIYGSFIAYSIIMLIWWEIVDYNEVWRNRT